MLCVTVVTFYAAVIFLFCVTVVNIVYSSAIFILYYGGNCCVQR